MIYGMTPPQFALLDKLVLEPLKALGAEVFIFGSRVSGTHHPHSDVDLLFRVAQGHSIPVHAISDIKEAIEESKFPFTVDLVAENDLAASYRETVMDSIKRL